MLELANSCSMEGLTAFRQHCAFCEVSDDKRKPLTNEVSTAGGWTRGALPDDWACEVICEATAAMEEEEEEEKEVMSGVAGCAAKTLTASFLQEKDKGALIA